MLDVQELVRNNKPIYVKNCTGDFLQKQGPFILEIKDGNSRTAQVIIPATKYPFLVSAHVPAKLLAQSTEFYAALSKGILELVDPDAARKTMTSPIAQKVQDAAMRKFQPRRREDKKPPDLPVSHNRDDRRPPGANVGISHAPEDLKPPELRVAEPVSNVNPTVEVIVTDLKSDPSLYDEKYLELAGMEGLTIDDHGYLMTSCKDFPKILQLARTELAELAGADAVAEVEDDQEIAAAGKTTKRRRRRK